MICFSTPFHLLVFLRAALKEDPWLAEEIHWYQYILWFIVIAGGLVLFFFPFYSFFLLA